MTYTDAHPSPQFPDRPDHPHFRLLSQLAQDQDGDSRERGTDWSPQDFFDAEKVDGKSVLHMCLHRSTFAANHLTTVHATAAACWLDAFMLGYLFALNRPDAP